MGKRLPIRPKLLCPRCHTDIGGIISLNALREWFKLMDRRATLSKIRVRRGERLRAMTKLRRLIVMEGFEVNENTGTDGRLRLKVLAKEIVQLISPLIIEQIESENELALMVEKKIVEFFNSTDQ